VCFKARRGGLVRCERCGCYQTDPPPLTDSDRAKEFYTQYYASHEVLANPAPVTGDSRTAGFWKVASQVPVLQKVETRIADIGCGDGHLCRELVYAGWSKVVGVEASDVRVERARKFYPQVTFHSSSLGEGGEAPGSFDVIVMEAVIEHLPDPVGLLRELRRFLRAGGRIVLTTPNLDSGHFRVLGRRWTGMLAPHAHIFMFTESSIKEVMELAGFEAEAAGSFRDAHYTIKQWTKRLFSGDVKGAIWRAHQEMGTLYGRMIGKHEMLFGVGRVR